ncbi:alpha/beta fold hydrolase [Desulfuromonas acetoxidans]|uniref:Alpha/beta hydrolase fold n=1 Tax=Desulfuromonas acetoxidans (strain DSM 684 / 11070) TaxID=281689 RepID=Q1K0E3_DESA6|nr:alpha/beta fold hydrolase [Desulfuromonas acetoxidans]EAT15998.1 alpha/beta hydrolase fold [Desulfuromonas acetoxidans DSM 684]MBF0644103.1 alpha/beta fold hydrolase [Desulfuromonas acetoxidans]NVD24598.1 alpha/beta fold hydrolase [Desulfuromonas acetoxidans]NVE16452.1 alpha/beta fold hydrolase [Desulfuromonas acetoxidans]
MTVYSPPFYLRNGHLQTIYPTLFRKLGMPAYQRERITTADDDFLDLDWACVGGKTLVILCHGLEGNSTRDYIKGMVKAVNDQGLDALAWNYRGCSAEPNRQKIMYHNGATYDLNTVIQHAAGTQHYAHIFVIGFSMGGNLALLYAGQQAENIHHLIRGIIGFSVPCELSHSSRALEHPACTIYMKRFLIKLHKKLQSKSSQFPNDIIIDNYHQIKTFKQFDDRYTAPLHGFTDAEDYWHRCSCNRHLTHIRVPTLIVNALDDPFLLDDCYPHALVSANHHLTLETPSHGGHVGFILPGTTYWSEQRALSFIEQQLRSLSTCLTTPQNSAISRTLSDCCDD